MPIYIVDIQYFLSRRLDFIRQLYNTACKPYLERKRKIETKEEPFVPTYSEDDEPTFLKEWIEAEESLHVLAYSCVSMVAAALHVYLETWISESGVPVEEEQKNLFKKIGWFAGYKNHFLERFEIDFNKYPGQLKLLEEIIIVRNRFQHPSSIISNKVQYRDSDKKTLSCPFFLGEFEVSLLVNSDVEIGWLIPPSISVIEGQLDAAITVVQDFALWFEPRIGSRIYPR